jgi:transcription elongation factor GreA
VNSSSHPITQETFRKLNDELDQLKKVDRPTIIAAIQEARAQGDLKENAEYHAAREKQTEIEDRITYLENRIATAEVISVDTANAQHVVFGATVTIKNLDTQTTIEYTLVSSDAVDVLAGKISSSSPVGRALIGKKRGDVIEVQIPKGKQRLEVLDYR